ncbi:MAG TPA: GNAT family N-acetyltransferase [Bacillota bacterium]|nr:GNAT family N-acetyltransferase [Bacillota bacterium]
MTNRLLMRALEKEDLPFIHELFNDSAITNYWFMEPYLSFGKLEKDYEANHAKSDIRQFVLENKQKERIGYIGLYNIDFNHRHAEFGIIIHPNFQGEGYAKEATKCAIDYSFLRLNLHKLYLYVAEKNEKAMHIYKQVGFKTEGILKEHYFINGSYENCLMMSLIRD